jgi:hypothetical protein
MDINFSIDGTIDPIAAYAAIVSTIIAVWEYLKWRKKNEVSLTCTPNMEFFPSNDKKTFIIANVTNKGETQTTVTHFMGYYWESWWDRIFRKNRKAFIVNSPDIPKVIQPGEQWMGQAHQDANIEKMAREGLLYMGISHSMNKKEVLRRVKINKENKES